jgi:hypothetical protein
MIKDSPSSGCDGALKKLNDKTFVLILLSKTWPCSCLETYSSSFTPAECTENKLEMLLVPQVSDDTGQHICDARVSIPPSPQYLNALLL